MYVKVENIINTDAYMTRYIVQLTMKINAWLVMRCVHLSSWILCKLSFMRLQSDNCKHVYHLTFYKSKHWKLLCQGTLINFNKHANTEDAISYVLSCDATYLRHKHTVLLCLAQRETR